MEEARIFPVKIRQKELLRPNAANTSITPPEAQK